ncbi:ETC complex I subunit (plasmid) [Skermanella rosea]|uniref:NADH dehydrogenase ubiquinone Fe-S protein 4 n=1 Tax=Skermanella rosea TaxID=1817965 RepID=UPI00193455D4|nr:NADH dehydrogenase ubiquinone Fe-S protein 4 [Skermanella rosea]UEM06854.1 ETC complex I subunit [Skermanella rosea]
MEKLQADTRKVPPDSPALGLAPMIPPMPEPLPQPANDPVRAARSSAFPPGTTAVIRKSARNAATSGKAGSRGWVLSFRPRSAQFVEPLMGWCGGDDPLRHVELRFPSRQAAIGYAQRQGIAYEAGAPAEDRRTVGRMATPGTVMTDLGLLGPDPDGDSGSRWSAAEVERAILNPARTFQDPSEVVADPGLTSSEKRRILKSWEWDALRIEATRYEAPFEDEPSHLEEVRAALRALDASGPAPVPANANDRPGQDAARAA